MSCLNSSREQDGNLGPGAARAQNRHSMSAARCAGWGRDRKDAGIPETSKVPALHREAERDTTGSISRQPLVHTWIGRPVQGKRHSAATLSLIFRKFLKSQ